MINNFKDILEKEIETFLETKLENKYRIVKNDPINDTIIAISLEPIPEKCNNNFHRGEFALRAVVLDNYNEIHISNLVCTGIFKGKGMAKKLIEVIYQKGKEYDYNTFLVNISPSFFNSMRRRKAEVISKKIMKITDETDLTTIRNTPKAYSNEISKCKNVKEEFLPYLPVHSNAISFIKWKQRKIDYILSDFEFTNIRNIMKEENNNKLFLPDFDMEYIIDTYFNSEDPYSLDKEICEQFYFYIWKTNPIIDLLKKSGTGYTIIDRHNHELCTLSSGEYYKYSPISFKDIDDLKRKMLKELNSDILNILIWAKSKDKVIFHAIEQKPLR